MYDCACKSTMERRHVMYLGQSNHVIYENIRVFSLPNNGLPLGSQ
jgi:hypothetical protein